MNTNQRFLSILLSSTLLLAPLTLNGSKLTRGFAFVAYPARYRNSSVMTFMVNQTGIIHQQDLGAQTTDIASAMREYNSGSGWERVE
jgi:hypothetical protein